MIQKHGGKAVLLMSKVKNYLKAGWAFEVDVSDVQIAVVDLVPLDKYDTLYMKLVEQKLVVPATLTPGNIFICDVTER